MKLIFLVGLTLFTGNLWSQAGANYVGYGQNIANPFNSFGLSNNPGLFPTDKNSFGAYARKRFVGTDINEGGLAGHVSAKNTAIGMQLFYHGTEYFYHNKLSASLCQKITKSLSIGISGGITGIYQHGAYPNATAITAGIGCNIKLRENLEVSTVLQDPWRNAVSNNFQNAQSAIALNYKTDKNTNIIFQYRNHLFNNAVYGIALRHQPFKTLALFAAFQNGKEPISGGMEYIKQNLHFAFASSWHVNLGITPAFTLRWMSK